MHQTLHVGPFRAQAVLLCVALLHIALCAQPVAAQVTGLSRTASMLAQPRPDADSVRILVYGQSISQQDWWKAVRDSLVRRYPAAQIRVVNRAVGGFSSDRLKLLAAGDMVPFYPDLVLFHDYGNEEDYESIVRLIRSRTTAEIVLMNDHFAPKQNNEWHDRHSFEWLPELARRYGLSFLDARGGWLEYLKLNGLEPQALLSDDVHLNEHGNRLMAALVLRHLTFAAGPPQPDTLVTTYVSGRDFRIEGSRVRLPFSGNRVDLVWDPDAPAGPPVKVQLNGAPPSQTLECWYASRPGENLGSRSWPPRMSMPVAVALKGLPRQEEWTLRVTSVDTSGAVSFQVHGSESGHEGSGTSEESYEGAVNVIHPEFWFRRKNPGDFSFLPLVQPGEVISWSVQSMCRDQATPGGSVTTVVQGVRNGEHTLELNGEAGLRSLRAIRVYRPPLQDNEGDVIP